MLAMAAVLALSGVYAGCERHSFENSEGQKDGTKSLYEEHGGGHEAEDEGDHKGGESGAGPEKAKHEESGHEGAKGDHAPKKER